MPLNLSEREIYVLVLLGIVIVIILYSNFRKNQYDILWSPMTIVSIIFIYYLFVGPLISIYTGETIGWLVDHRPYFYNSWLAGTLSYFSILTGFNLTKKINAKKVKISYDPRPEDIRKSGIRLLILGLIFFTIIAGTGIIRQLNFLEESGSSEGYSGAFSNYFLFGINFFVPAACFLLYSYLDRRLSIFILFGGIFIAFALYTSSGFRYRIVLLGLGLLITFYLHKGKKPSLPVLLIFGVSFIILMGFIGSARKYGQGLDVTKIEGKSNYELFLSGIGESITFQTTGLLIERIPKYHDFIGFDPVWQSIVFPIPRRLWPSKPSGDYIRIINELYLENNILGIGAAVLNYGEYYLSFGWTGIILISALIGFIIKKLWLWYLVNRDNPFARITYAVAVSFLYVLVSRGYLPQVTLNFFFTVMPCVVIMWIYGRKSRKTKFVERI